MLFCGGDDVGNQLTNHEVLKLLFLIEIIPRYINSQYIVKIGNYIKEQPTEKNKNGEASALSYLLDLKKEEQDGIERK